MNDYKDFETLSLQSEEIKEDEKIIKQSAMLYIVRVSFENKLK